MTVDEIWESEEKLEEFKKWLAPLPRGSVIPPGIILRVSEHDALLISNALECYTGYLTAQLQGGQLTGEAAAIEEKTLEEAKRLLLRFKPF